MRLLHLECVVDEKRLADVMFDLSGKVSNLEIKPIKNAEKAKNGTVKAITSGTYPDRLLEFIHRNNLAQITGAQAKDVLCDAPSQSVYAAIYALIEAKQLAYTTKGNGIYRVVRNQSERA